MYIVSIEYTTPLYGTHNIYMEITLRFYHRVTKVLGVFLNILSEFQRENFHISKCLYF